MPGAQGPKTVKGAQSDPNYASRLCIRLRTGISQNHNVKVSLLVWRIRYTDTFSNAVDCRFELALEVQRWTRARSECLPGAQNL